MDLSGIIFVVLALAWAVYLIPKALKHHDELARSRSIDRFSNAMRVLARREAVDPRNARLVVTPPRPADTPRMLVPSPAAATSTEGVRRTSARSAARRAAARAAARRRRRVLVLLLVATAVVAVLAGVAVVPWWSVSIPAVLTVTFLWLCRRQVRRDNEAIWSQDSSASEEPAAEPRRAVRIDAPYGIPAGSVVAARNDQGFEEVSPDEDTIALPATAVAAAVTAASVAEADHAAARAVEVETVPVSVPTLDGGSLWDPLPVTLPTYVTKPRAARTVRTIDLGQPGTWTSGRSEADSKLVEEANAAAEESTSAEEGRRAVGS